MPVAPITPAQTDAPDPVPRDWRTVMRNLLTEHDKNVCMHEETHRGGFLWTICDQCGRKWADDEGGFQAYEEPTAVTEAWALLEKGKAPAQTDALAKLAEIPAVGSEERSAWLDIAEELGFDRTDTAVLTLMSEARKQGQRDILGASSTTTEPSPSAEAPTEPRPTGVDPSRVEAAAKDCYRVTNESIAAAMFRGWEPQAWEELREYERELHRDYARVGLAAVIPSGGQWQPIETAPKDGTHILVGRNGVSPARAWFEGDRWWMHGCGPYSAARADLTGRYAPTHWMPLPLPPSASCDEQLKTEDRDSGLSPKDASAVGEAETPEATPQATPSSPQDHPLSDPQMTVEEAREVLGELDTEFPPSQVAERMRDIASWYRGSSAARGFLEQAIRIETALRILSSNPAAVLREPGKGGRS